MILNRFQTFPKKRYAEQVVQIAKIVLLAVALVYRLLADLHPDSPNGLPKFAHIPDGVQFVLAEKPRAILCHANPLNGTKKAYDQGLCAIKFWVQYVLHRCF